MIESDYIVYRAGPRLGDVALPEHLLGTWHDIGGLEPDRHDGVLIGWPSPTSAVIATPTNRFEFRPDGACAEVWELNVSEESQ